MATINERYTKIVELNAQLWKNHPDFEKPERPSCKNEFQNAVKWHFVVIAVFFAIVFLLGEEFMRTISLVTLIICGSVTWIASFVLTLIFILKKFKDDVAEYQRIAERQEKQEDAHVARLFQYLDKAMADCWKESASMAEQKKNDEGTPEK